MGKRLGAIILETTWSGIWWNTFGVSGEKKTRVRRKEGSVKNKEEEKEKKGKRRGKVLKYP